MPLVKILARHLVCELNTGTVAIPVWTPIGGLTTVTFKTSKDSVDDTDFNSAGWAEHKVAQRSVAITLEGFYKEDPVTGTRDPGQEALITLGDAVGYDSTKPLRMTTPGGNTTLYQVSAQVDGPAGGGTNDNSGFKAELEVSGKPVYTPSP